MKKIQSKCVCTHHVSTLLPLHAYVCFHHDSLPPYLHKFFMDGPLTNNANFEEQDCKARIKEHEPNQKALDYWELTVSHYRPTIKKL